MLWNKKLSGRFLLVYIEVKFVIASEFLKVFDYFANLLLLTTWKSKIYPKILESVTFFVS